MAIVEHRGRRAGHCCRRYCSVVLVVCAVFFGVLSCVVGIPDRGTFTPQDLLGSFQLDSENSDDDCAKTLEQRSVFGEGGGGFILERTGMTVNGVKCKGRSDVGVRVIPGRGRLDGDVGDAVKKLEGDVKGLMSGIDRGESGGDCGGIGKGVWVFVREAKGAGQKTLKVGGKSVKLEDGIRNVVFIKDGDKAICKFVGAKKVKKPSGSKKPKPASVSDDDDDEDNDPQQTPSNTNASSSAGSSSNPACFPSDAVVTLESGLVKTMSELEVGDRVLVTASDSATARYSPVILFTHREPSVRVAFLKVTLQQSSSTPLHLTPGHFIYINGILSPAYTLRPGDKLSHINGEGTVISVERVMKTGLYNPQTMHGDIVVNGVLASTYTTAVHPTVAKGLLMPVKAAYVCGLPVFNGLFDGGAGYFAPVVALLQRLAPAVELK